MKINITLRDTGSEQAAKEIRLSDISIDSAKTLVCLDIVDISKPDDRLITQAHISAEDLYEAARMLVARVGKVTARY